MIDGLDLVIDGDGHVIEVNETYERIDPKYRERRPVYTQASRGNIVRLGDGKVWGPDTECGFVGVNGNLPPPLGKAIHYRRMGTYNPWARLADMDRDQIDVAVIYPTDELPLTVTHDAGFAAARARAYNDWLHDYCEVCPQRLKGVGLVALQDVPGAIEEMHRAVSRLNMVAVQIGCTVREDTLLSDPRLTAFWAEPERLNGAVAVHGPALPSLFRGYFDLNRPDHMLEVSHMAHTFAQMLACSNIITSGVLERFSRLKVAFLEAGAGWCPTGCTAWTSTTRSRRSGGRTSRRSRASTSRAAACSFPASPATSSSRSSSTTSGRTRCCSPRIICTSTRDRKSVV